jgi:hypothetical protein
MHLFNPPEPTCQPTQAGVVRDGTGTGDVRCVPPAYQIDVEFTVDDYDPHAFNYYPAAEGHHVLHRVLIGDSPFEFLPQPVDFRREDLGIALWDSTDPEAPPTLEDRFGNIVPFGPGIGWRLAYNWPWSRVSGQAMDPEDSLAALGPLLDLLAAMGITIDPEEIGGELGGFPPDAAWVLWYGPEYWRAAAQIEELNVVFPWYLATEHRSQSGTHRNLWRGLHPNTMGRHFAGNDAIGGIFELLEFPETITVKPWWP